VVGVPGGLGGEEVWAFVAPEQGAEVDPRELRVFCRGTLAVYQIPEVVRVRADLPRSASGKAQKFRLREMALREKEEGER